MFIYQHLTLLFSKVTPEKAVWISICNKQQEFVAVKVPQCKIIHGFSRHIWSLSNLPNSPQPQGKNCMSPSLLPVFDISPLSSPNAILWGAYSTFWRTLLNLQYPNSIIYMWKLSTDKVNAFSEQTYVADTKAPFGTKEYVKRKGNQFPLFVQQDLTICKVLSIVVSWIEVSRSEQHEVGLEKCSTELRVCSSTRCKMIMCPQNKPRTEFTRVAMQRVIQYLSPLGTLGHCLWLGGQLVQLPENSWRPDLPLSF